MKCATVTITLPKSATAKAWLEGVPGVRTRGRKVIIPVDAASFVYRRLFAMGERPGVLEQYVPPMTALEVGAPLAGLKPGIEAWLMPYQRDFANFFRRRGAVIAHHPGGAGKTISSIAAAQQRPAGHVVVVTLAGHKRHWRSEIERTSTARAQIIDGEAEAALTDARYIVIGWETLAAHAARLAEIPIGVLIVDESQRMQDRRGVWSKAVRDLGAKAQSVILCTATPAPDLLANWYPQLHLLAPWSFGGFWGKPGFPGFAPRYCEGRAVQIDGVGEVWKAEGCDAEHLPELRARVAWYKHRVTTAQALGALPPLRRTVHMLPKSELLADKLPADLRDQIKRGGRSESAFEARLAIAAYRKRPWIVQTVVEALEQDRKVLVFTGRHKDVEDIAEMVQRRAPKHAAIWAVHGGNTTGAERERIVGLRLPDGVYPPDSYMGTPGCAALIATADTLGVGVNLQDTDVLVMAMLPWNPGRLHQYEQRVHRLGGVRRPEIHYPVAEGTVDEAVSENLLAKLAPYEALGGQGDLSDLHAKLTGQDDPQACLDALWRATVGHAPGEGD